MKKLDLTNVQESQGFSNPTAGAYICKITDVVDIPEKEYLKVEYDIIDGEFAGYYAKGRADHPDWAWFGRYTKSYKPNALPMFKRFCSAVSKSNASYVFDGGAANSDEKTLIGKKIGLLFQEEEYYGNDGDLKTRLKIYSEFPIDKIREQKTPKIKKVAEGPAPKSDDDGFLNAPVDASDIPFV